MKQRVPPDRSRNPTQKNRGKDVEKTFQNPDGRTILRFSAGVYSNLAQWSGKYIEVHTVACTYGASQDACYAHFSQPRIHALTGRTVWRDSPSWSSYMIPSITFSHRSRPLRLSRVSRFHSASKKSMKSMELCQQEQRRKDWTNARICPGRHAAISLLEYQLFMDLRDSIFLRNFIWAMQIPRVLSLVASNISPSTWTCAQGQAISLQPKRHNATIIQGQALDAFAVSYHSFT